MKIWTVQEALAKLKVEIDRAGGQRAFAKANGVCGSLVNETLAGSMVSPSVLACIGLEKRTIITNAG